MLLMYRDFHLAFRVTSKSFLHEVGFFGRTKAKAACAITAIFTIPISLAGWYGYTFNFSNQNCNNFNNIKHAISI
jgi:hypothetical protein